MPVSTTVASIFLVLWSRVEFQVVNYMPWMVLSRLGSPEENLRRKDVSHTLLLDYACMWFPQRIYTSFKNRHYQVTAATLVTLFLRIEIWLATGVFERSIIDGGQTILSLQPGKTHTTAAIYGLCTLLTIPIISLAPNGDGIAPRDPTSMGGLAAILRNSHGLLHDLCGTGAKDISLVGDRLRGSWSSSVLLRPGQDPEFVYQIKGLDSKKHSLAINMGFSDINITEIYHPWTIKPVAQYISIFICAVFILAIWLVYGTRGSHNRFSPPENETFLWTALVTIFFVSLSTYVSWLDYDLRRLTPLIRLATSKQSLYTETLGLAYTNELGLQTAFRCMWYSDWKVFFSKLIILWTWLMPIFTAGLFAMQRYERDGPATLQPQSYFDIQAGQSGVLLGSNTQLAEQILLDSPPTYPKSTYEDLAFPVLSLKADKASWMTSAMAFSATVGATKASLGCQTEVLSNGDGNSLTCISLESKSIKTCNKGQAVTGFVAESCQGLSFNASLNYIWGDCSDSGSITVLSCNETVVSVDAYVSYNSGYLDIDPNNPPIVVNGDQQKRITGDLSLDGVYDILSGVPAGTDNASSLDPFFTTLVQSPGGIPMDRLLSAERTNSVMQAIYTQHGIIRAQALNTATIRKTVSSTSPPAPISASFAYYHLELLQAQPQTVALTILLALTIIFSALLAIYRHRETNLPKNPSSIAAQASMLADSTIWWHLPRDVQYLTNTQLARRLRKKTFRLGPIEGTGMRRNGRNFTVGILQDVNKARRPVEVEDVMMMMGGANNNDDLDTASGDEEEEEYEEYDFETLEEDRMELEGDTGFDDHRARESSDEERIVEKLIQGTSFVHL